ncbi:MAG: lipase family protein [Bacilli bacterium]
MIQTRTLIPLETGLTLVDCCKEAYEMFFQQGAVNTIPNGHRLIHRFKATALHREEWFGYILENDEAWIVVFRGSVSDGNWLADADITQSVFPFIRDGGYVHNGFLEIYASCRNELIDLCSSMPFDKKLYITGHSLGGALATLFAVEIANALRNCNQSLITFASPKVGDKQFAQQANLLLEESYRFVNLNDLVPLLPPSYVKFQRTKQRYAYTHIPHAVTFSIEGGSAFENHRVATYRKGVYRLLATTT